MRSLQARGAIAGVLKHSVNTIGAHNGFGSMP